MSDTIGPICPWCRKPVLPYESQTIYDGDTFHLSCAEESEDDAFFDRDMEFGS